MFKQTQSLVTPEQRRYVETVSLHNPYLQPHMSINGSPVTPKQMSENLLSDRKPFQPDYSDRLQVSDMLEKGIAPEKIVEKCSNMFYGGLGLLYEIRDCHNRVIYVGYTQTTLKHRKNGHNTQTNKHRSPFHLLLKKDKQTTDRIVGIGTTDDENRLINARFVGGHEILNSKIPGHPTLDLYVSEWHNNRQFSLWNGIPSVRRWNTKTAKIEHDNNPTIFTPRDVCLVGNRARHRALLTQEQLIAHEDFVWFNPQQQLIETVCCVCGTLGLIPAKDARKYPLTHALPSCCGQSTNLVYSPEQTDSSWPHNQRLPCPTKIFSNKAPAKPTTPRSKCHPTTL